MHSLPSPQSLAIFTGYVLGAFALYVGLPEQMPPSWTGWRWSVARGDVGSPRRTTVADAAVRRQTVGSDCVGNRGDGLWRRGGYGLPRPCVSCQPSRSDGVPPSGLNQSSRAVESTSREALESRRYLPAGSTAMSSGRNTRPPTLPSPSKTVRITIVCFSNARISSTACLP
jgi:hypothetical protein